MSTTPIFVTEQQLAAGRATEQGRSGDIAWQVATLRKRALASLLDSTLVFTAAVLLLLPIWVAREGSLELYPGLMEPADDAASTKDLLFAALDAAVLAVVGTVYHGVMTARRGLGNGRTLGKMMVGIRVATREGAALSRGRAWRRAAWVAVLTGGVALPAALVDAALGTVPTGVFVGELLIALLLAGSVAFAAGPERRTFQDRLAGTVVVDFRAAGAPITAETPHDAAGPVTAPVLPRRWTKGTVIGVAAAILLSVFLGAVRPLTDTVAIPDPQAAEEVRPAPAPDPDADAGSLS